MDIPLITNIQRYSIHDGYGIRTTVFFKGCPLSCGWCHNPETQGYEKELLFNNEKCVGCLKCMDGCQNNAIYIEENILKLDKSKCIACGKCIDDCVYGARAISGKEYDINSLLKELEKDDMFYEESNGGITLSGGEVMSQNIDYIESLTRKLDGRGYDIAIDTSGYVAYDRFERIINYINTILFDIKVMNNDLHKKYIGVDNKLILENLKKLSKEKVKIYLRLPLIDGVNCDDENINKIIAVLKEYDIKVTEINLLPYHDIGAAKYCRLQRSYNNEFKVPSEKRLEEILDLFILNGFKNIKIGG